MSDTYYEIQDEHGANVGECYDRNLAQSLERAVFTACAVPGLGPLYCKRVTARMLVNVRQAPHGATTRTSTHRTEELELCRVFGDELEVLEGQWLTAGEERMLELFDLGATLRRFRAVLTDPPATARHRRPDRIDVMRPGLLQAA